MKKVKRGCGEKEDRDNGFPPGWKNRDLWRWGREEVLVSPGRVGIWGQSSSSETLESSYKRNRDVGNGQPREGLFSKTLTTQDPGSLAIPGSPKNLENT